MPTDTLYDWCVEHRDIMQQDLKEYESGARNINELIGDEIVDCTADEISDLKQRIAKLEGIIKAYDARKA